MSHLPELSTTVITGNSRREKPYRHLGRGGNRAAATRHSRCRIDCHDLLLTSCLQKVRSRSESSSRKQSSSEKICTAFVNRSEVHRVEVQGLGEVDSFLAHEDHSHPRFAAMQKVAQLTRIGNHLGLPPLSIRTQKERKVQIR